MRKHNFIQLGIIGFILLIVGFYVLNYTGVKQTEVPALLCAAGFSLVILAILQRIFLNHKLPTRMLMFGLISLCFPAMLVWKASFTPWLLFPFGVVGLILIIRGIRRRRKPTIT